MNESSSIVMSNVGIIHLSDIHFSNEISLSQEKWELLFRALKEDFLECQTVYIVVSGDIASTGKDFEYKIAERYFNDFLKQLQKRYNSMQFKFIFVPGNHDCNFDYDNQARMNAIKNVNYEIIGDDDSVFKIGLQTQSDFWKFYSTFNGCPENKIYYRIVDAIADKKLCFHCFNTSWMSQKNEKAGTLFFPVKSINGLIEKDEFDLNIAVFHHPLNWLNPDTPENNNREFKKLLDDISSFQLVGHEHESESRKTEDICNADSQTFCFSGDIIQNKDNPNRSGFQTFSINLNTNKLKLKIYRWDETQNIYRSLSDKDIMLSKKTHRIVEPNNIFIEKLDNIGMPLNFGDKNKKVNLSNIYIFPDLEMLTSKQNNVIDGYFDSETIIEKNQFKNCIFEGESQIGKSSLLYMLFLKYYRKGFYPIFLEGKDINSNDSDKIIHKAFKSQYSEDPVFYEKFKQIDNDKKILLIDDLHTTKLEKYAKNNLTSFFNVFSRIFITFDAAYSIMPQIQTEFKDICLFSIKSFGYKKRNDLIERYLSLKDDPSLKSTQDYLDRTKQTFDQLKQILGDKLIPSYPVFVLSIIQALEYTSLNLNETSYGYCYQALIYYALNKAEVLKDDIDTYVNIITELAFKMFTTKTDSISEREYETFYTEYGEKYVAPRFETVLNKLIDSKLLKKDSDSIGFGYKYILYFLAAKKIAEMIEMPEGKKIVKELYDNLHEEHNANILVLITHHTKNYTFINDSIFTLMLPFEKTFPITLEKNCNYYKLLEEIVKEIKQEIISGRRSDPIDERNKQLLIKDKHDREINQDKEERIIPNANVNEKTLQYLRAFRSIEIVGQIIRNRKGSLEKQQLKDMIIELYKTGFRMISHMGEMIKEVKADLVIKIEEKRTASDTNQDIEKKIYKFLQFVSLQMCLGVFSKILSSVGVKELREMYSDVAETIGSPAAKIVSFSINSYYGKINMKELEKISKEFKDNYVVLQILRARVKSYIYNNYVDYHDKQKIAALLSMNVSPTLGRKNTGY